MRKPLDASADKTGASLATQNDNRRLPAGELLFVAIDIRILVGIVVKPTLVILEDFVLKAKNILLPALNCPADRDHPPAFPLRSGDERECDAAVAGSNGGGRRAGRELPDQRQNQLPISGIHAFDPSSVRPDGISPLRIYIGVVVGRSVMGQDRDFRGARRFSLVFRDN